MSNNRLQTRFGLFELRGCDFPAREVEIIELCDAARFVGPRVADVLEHRRAIVQHESHLYRDESAVMRLVGATEFYIRGPFYLEGMFQGLLGSLAALAGLVGAYFGLAPDVGRSLMASSLLHRFLTPGEIAGLLGFGALAGLVGAIVSLGREPIGGEASD